MLKIRLVTGSVDGAESFPIAGCGSAGGVARGCGEPNPTACGRPGTELSALLRMATQSLQLLDAPLCGPCVLTGLGPRYTWNT